MVMSSAIPITPVPISYEQYYSQQVQPLTVQAEWFQTVIGVVMAVWAGAFVLQQVTKMFKGEVVERPPLIK